MDDIIDEGEENSEDLDTFADLGDVTFVDREPPSDEDCEDRTGIEISDEESDETTSSESSDS